MRRTATWSVYVTLARTLRRVPSSTQAGILLGEAAGCIRNEMCKAWPACAFPCQHSQPCAPEPKVFQGGPTGYGNKNAVREVFHIEYMLERWDFKYYLRVDDDGFLCARQLLEELRWLMPASFPGEILHGKYHCHAAKVQPSKTAKLTGSAANLRRCTIPKAVEAPAMR